MTPDAGADEFTHGGLVPRSERVPVEQWTLLRLTPPEPNPYPMPNDMDEWVASFVAAADSSFRKRPAPAPTGLPEAWRLPAPTEGPRDDDH